MEQVFRVVLNISYTGGLAILALLLIRLLLKKAPRWLPYLLWSVAFFRLLCPFSFESALALLPSVEPLPQEFLTTRTPELHTGFAALNAYVNPALTNSMAPAPYASVNPAQVLLWALGWVWAAGFFCMLIYALYSMLRFSRGIRFATLVEPGVYESDQIDTAFIIGLIRPKVYLPTGLSAEARRMILLHERTHIRRCDYLWKPLSFFVLMFHWFNPLVYAFYFCFDRDMELSCDEAVLKNADGDIRQTYSTTLLAVSAARGMLAAPLAFGESSTKLRIRNILQYRKKTFWVAVAGVLLAAAAAAVLLLNPLPPSLPVNAITEVPVTESERAALTMLPESQTPYRYAYRADASIKSMRIYVEGWRKGAYDGTFSNTVLPIDRREGTFVVSEIATYGGIYSSLRNMSGLSWTVLDESSGELTTFSSELPPDFIPIASAASFLYYGEEDGTWPIGVDEPILLGNVVFGEGNILHSYNCQYLMEDPEAIARHEYVYLFWCVFSARSVEELTREPSIVLVKDGKAARTVAITGNAAYEELAQTVVWNHLVLSAAWPAVDVDAFGYRIELNTRIAEDSETTTFYIFVQDGRPCIQAGRNGMWTSMPKDLYAQLHAVAAGEPLTTPAP